MEILHNFTARNLIHMMYASEDIGTFKALMEKEQDPEKWSQLLHVCYWEESYESVGGDTGWLENPPINTRRLAYLKELIAFLEGAGIHAINDTPGAK